MSERTITSLALLQVNWDRHGRDYIDNFVPFVAEALLQAPQDVIGLPDLAAAVQATCGLHLPAGPLKTVLNRCVQQGYATVQNRTYLRNVEALRSLKISQDRAVVLRQQGALVRRLMEFAQSEFDTAWDEEAAWNALLEYVRENPVAMVAVALDQAPVPAPSQHVPHARVIIGSFVEHLRLRDPDGFCYFCALVKGSMLSSVLLFPDMATVQRRFERTAMYFDTKVLQQVLGLEGKEVAQPLHELLRLLRAEGAELRCFEHTVDELRSNLHGLADELRQGGRGVRRPSEMLEYFLATNRTASDVDLVLARLDERIRGLHILPTPRPAHVEALTVDENRLTEVLQEGVHYKNERARQHDLDAITAVHRLRGDRRPQDLERSRALFVTSNDNLAAASAHFFRQEYPKARTLVPHCMTDHLLATLVWLKQPTIAPDLPHSRLVADAYVALNPPEEIWRRYLQKIAQQHEMGEVSEGDYHLLRHDITAKRELMHITLGEPSAFVDDTVPRVLARARAHARADIEDQLQAKEQALAIAHAQVADAEARMAAEQVARGAAVARVMANLQERLDAQQQRLNSVARRIARGLRVALTVLCALPLILAVWSTIPTPFPPPPGWLRPPVPVAVTSLFLLLVLTVSGLLEGFSLHSALAPVETRVANRIEIGLRRLFPMLDAPEQLSEHNPADRGDESTGH